jgi:hypothetical protein
MKPASLIPAAFLFVRAVPDNRAGRDDFSVVLVRPAGETRVTVGTRKPVRTTRASVRTVVGC